MDSFLGIFIFILALVWAFRIEKNTAITAETLQRLEKKLSDSEAKKEK